VNAADKSLPLVPPPATSAPVAEETALYEIRKKIYPRAVSGKFMRWRWALIFATQLVYYGMPWLSWNDRQAVLFDIAARKFYIFGLVFWPQDVIYLSVLLILAAFSLFLFTAVAGRLWCGYACPQTVYTEIFLWVERKIEGDRTAQMRLDREAWSGTKFAKKAAKHAVWIAISVWTGITFVGYFTPIHSLLGAIPARLGGWETFWILFYGGATYGNAGWMREQVCKYMCPYARFQSVMFDRTRSSSPTTPDAANRAVRAAERPTSRRPAWATAWTAASASRCVRRGSTSGKDCSTNASAARPASTAAIR
jgi:cytochrome c oxidase accessory protein FixG